MALKTLNLSLFRGEKDAERRGFAADLRREFVQHGFVKIIGHGISEEDIEEAFAWVSSTLDVIKRSRSDAESGDCDTQNRKFFELEPAVKTTIAHVSDSDPQRGWSAGKSRFAASLCQRS